MSGFSQPMMTSSSSMPGGMAPLSNQRAIMPPMSQPMMSPMSNMAPMSTGGMSNMGMSAPPQKNGGWTLDSPMTPQVCLFSLFFGNLLNWFVSALPRRIRSFSFQCLLKI